MANLNEEMKMKKMKKEEMKMLIQSYLAQWRKEEEI